MERKDILLLSILGILNVAGTGWILTNYVSDDSDPHAVGIKIFGLAVFGMILFLFNVVADVFLKWSADVDAPEIDGAEVGGQAIGGFFGGVVPILLSIFTPLSMTVPVLPFSTVGNFLISTLGSPPVEEFGFLMLAVALYLVIFRATKSKALAILAVLVIDPALFALYHWWAYGETLLVSGAFLGAAVFRELTLLLVLGVSGAAGDTGFSLEAVAAVIIATIFMHFDFNGFTYVKGLSIVGS